MFIAVFMFIDAVCLSLHISTIRPYAISYDDQVICYVRNKEEAEKAIRNSAKNLLGPEAEVVSVQSDLKVAKAPLTKRREVTSKASDIISEKVKEKEITIETEAIKREGFDKAPEPIYKEAPDMLAGQSETVEEGTASKGEAVYRQKYVNDEIVGEEKVIETIKEEGTPAVVKKGTRGLPEGEDYRTYEGLPVCKSGDDIIATAASYIDEVPYVWGGKDLETGVDCSGFVMAIYKLYGIELNYPLEKEGISVSYDEAQPGDILCFKEHFGIYSGDGKMIHASRPGTYIMESSIGDRKILDVRRIVNS